MAPKFRPLKLSRKHHKKIGTPPGTVEYVGKQKVDEITISVHDYSPGHIDSMQLQSIEECRPYLENQSKTWIQVSGLHEVEKLHSIWAFFDLHPLIQEDIVNTSQRPKVEMYDNCLFVVMRMLRFTEDQQMVENEQLSIILGENFVLSFQESDRPVFKPVLERLNSKKGRIRQLGPDYLAYALIDNITDHYFNLLGICSDKVEMIEDELMDEPDENTFQNIHLLRKQITYIRKSIWSTRDMLNAIIRDESDFIRDDTKIFIRDVYDHMVQIMESVESNREMIMSMHDMYMTHVSNKMNEVMKVLTIIATIFIPLTFIAGVYGMNFNPEASPYNMPELNWYYGYPATWAVMIVVAIIMVIYFKKKEWL